MNKCFSIEKYPDMGPNNYYSLQRKVAKNLKTAALSILVCRMPFDLLLVKFYLFRSASRDFLESSLALASSLFVLR